MMALQSKWSNVSCHKGRVGTEGRWLSLHLRVTDAGSDALGTKGAWDCEFRPETH